LGHDTITLSQNIRNAVTCGAVSHPRITVVKLVQFHLLHTLKVHYTHTHTHRFGILKVTLMRLWSGCQQTVLYSQPAPSRKCLRGAAVHTPADKLKQTRAVTTTLLTPVLSRKLNASQKNLG